MARTKEDATATETATADVADQPKRGRGRPKGTGSGVKKVYVPTGRPRGRPKSAAKAPYTGKPRGRPKGTAKPADEKVEKSSKATPKKRGRRSKKDEDADAVEEARK